MVDVIILCTKLTIASVPNVQYPRLPTSKANVVVFCNELTNGSTPNVHCPKLPTSKAIVTYDKNRCLCRGYQIKPWEF